MIEIKYRGYTITEFDALLAQGLCISKRDEDEETTTSSLRAFDNFPQAKAYIDTIFHEKEAKYKDGLDTKVHICGIDVKAIREAYPEVLADVRDLVGTVVADILDRYLTPEYFDPDLFE